MCTHDFIKDAEGKKKKKTHNGIHLDTLYVRLLEGASRFFIPCLHCKSQHGCITA